MHTADIEPLVNELTSGDDEAAEAAAVKISVHGPGALPALQDLLVSPNPDTRWWAVRTVAEIRDPLVPPLLIEALNDADISVRQCAALGLRLQPYPQATPELVRALDANNRLYASLAADALIATGGAAVPALMNVMESGSHPARLEAVRALALIGDKRAIPVLFSALEENSALMEYWADEGLKRMGAGMVFFKP